MAGDLEPCRASLLSVRVSDGKEETLYVTSAMLGKGIVYQWWASAKHEVRVQDDVEPFKAFDLIGNSSSSQSRTRASGVVDW